MKCTIHCCDWQDDTHTVALVATLETEIPEHRRLEWLQKRVDGLIDVYHHAPTARDWVMNDEGLLLGLPLNDWALRHGLQIAGTIIEIHGVLP